MSELCLCVKPLCVIVSLSDSDFTSNVGVPVSSRVSTKIQQLLMTLKRPKRPPLSEFFTDDSEEIVEGTSLRSQYFSAAGFPQESQLCWIFFVDSNTVYNVVNMMY